MTDSISHSDLRKHPIAIAFGLATIGFCLYFCTMTVYSVFDGTFGSMGGLLMLTMAPFAAFLAFGFIRFLSYVDNPSEAWSVLACFLSALILYASGMTASYLEALFFSHDVEYRSINLDGYKQLYMMIYMPLLVVWLLRLQAWMGQFAFFKKTQNEFLSNLPKRRPLIQFVKEKWKYDLCLTILFFLFLTSAGFALVAICPPLPVHEESLSYDDFYRKDSFPREGSDFNYRRSSSSFLCDFAITEESFVRWVKTHPNWESYTVSHESPENVMQPALGSFDVVNGVAAGQKLDATSGVIERAIFDRDRNRVFYFRAIR